MGDYTCVTILEMEDATVAVGTRVSWRRLPDCRCTTLSGPIALTTEPSKPEIGIEVHTTNASALREAGFRGAPKDWGLGARSVSPVLLDHRRAAAQRKRSRIGLSGDDLLFEGAYAGARG